MKRHKVIKVKRLKTNNPAERSNLGIPGKIEIVHKIDLNPKKMLKRLFDFWI
ncbi:hypothetical protein WME73_13250 [Sorangium sp. So ce302]|uniref:hypothetical protein n=1 Tax=unclassified Sorangium TaxID=2621164 RepID=UPI003F5FB12C